MEHPFTLFDVCYAVGAQVGLLRLTALTAKLAPSSAASGGSRLMLWFLQCLLAHCLTAVNTFVAGEVKAVLGPRPDVMDKYLGKGASFCSRQAWVPGAAATSQGNVPHAEDGFQEACCCAELVSYSW